MENELVQYCLKRLEVLEKENAELKAKIENSQLNRSNFLYYKVDAYAWRISEDNYAQFEQAVNEWNYRWLDNNYLRVNSALADYEITIGDHTYYFRIETTPEGKMTFKQLDFNEEDLFDSYLAAKEYLIKTVLKEVEKIKKKIADRAQEQAQ